MHTSSYLEAFLSVYGWMMYNTLYELFAMTWLLFLPFMKLGFLTFIDTLSDSANRYGQFKKGIITFVLMLFALFLAVVPLDRIRIEGTTIAQHCKAQGSSNANEQRLKGNIPKMKEFYGFDVTSEGRVPLLPSLIMRISAGTNNVIYQSMPCAPSVRDFAMVMKTTEITDKGLREEVGRFDQECATPARDRMRRLAADAPTTYKAIYYLGAFNTQSKDGDHITDSQREHYPGSRLFQLMMTGDSSEIENLILPQEKEKFLNVLPKGNALYSASAVADVESDDPDMSQRQQANSSGIVKCTDWWNKKLYPALKENISNDVALKLAKDEFFRKDCYKTDGQYHYGSTTYGPYGLNYEFDLKSCQAAIDKAIGADDAFAHNLVFRGIYNTNNSNLALNTEDKNNLESLGMLGIIGAVLGSFVGLGDSVLSSIANNAASFYAQMFFYRVVLQMLQPMLLMGIFTFWGIYLIVGDYRWETILKGLILIFVISVMPGLWSISQHLDNALWQALYPEVTSLKDLANKSNGNYVERILLDAASTVFNVIFPLILMYLVNEAGGGRPGAAFQSSQTGAENIGGTSGRMAGNTAGAGVNTAGRATGKGIDGLRSWRAARRDKANLPPGGSRY